MSRTVKLVLYIICIIGVAVFGTLTLRAYRGAGRTVEHARQRLEHAAGTESTNAPAVTNAGAGTNSPEPSTNATDAATAPAAATTTNPAATNNPEPRKETHEAGEVPETAGVSARSYTKMVTCGLGLVIFGMGLAGLIAFDVSHFFGQRAQDIMFSNEGQPTDPQYERAEQLWADGKYLDSVRAMREYLVQNPREQYVALRIAEIYEQNLNNPLAAALEYEEVLKQKLAPERWGWAAIHLANIYSGKLNKADKAIELLHRIDAEYGQTAAANKARERLIQIDPTFVPAAASQPAPAPEPAPESVPPQAPERNLPPGFRPKN